MECGSGLTEASSTKEGQLIETARESLLGLSSISAGSSFLIHEGETSN